MSRPSRKLSVTKKPHTLQRGFTLVELLVVILILAILMAVALPLYLGAVRNSTRRVARANMKTLVNANLAYRTQKGEFTDNPLDLQAQEIIPNVPDGPGNALYTLFVGPVSLPDSRSLASGQAAACASDTVSNISYGCYIPGTDVD